VAACELQCIAMNFVLQHGIAIVEAVNLCLASCSRQRRLISIRFKMLNRRLHYRAQLPAKLARFTSLHEIFALLQEHSQLCFITADMNRLFQAQIVLFLPVFIPISQDLLFLLMNGGFFGKDLLLLFFIYTFLIGGLLTLYGVSYVILYCISAYNSKLMAIKKEAIRTNCHLYDTRCTLVKMKLANYWEVFEQRRSVRLGVTVGGLSIVTKLIMAKVRKENSQFTNILNCLSFLKQFTILYCRYTLLTWKALIYKYKIYHF